MKVKFLCRLLNRHKQQIDHLLTLDSEDRIREAMIAGSQVYEEFGLPPFALLYEGEGQMVVGFFALQCVEEDSDGELVAEGRFYIRENEKAYADYLIESIKKEYEEIKHLSVIGEEEVSFLTSYPHYMECFMRLSRESSNNVAKALERGTINTKAITEERKAKSCCSDEEKDKTLFHMEQFNKTQNEEVQFYLESLKDIFLMDDEVANQHIEECFEDCDCNLYVVKSGNKRIGTCGAYIGMKSDTIFDISIRKTEQGKGYGRQMLDMLLQRLYSPLKDVILQVSTRSEAAFHLYKEFGFHIEQKLIFYIVW